MPTTPRGESNSLGQPTYFDVQLPWPKPGLTVRLGLREYRDEDGNRLVHISMENPTQRDRAAEEADVVEGELRWARAVRWFESAINQTHADGQLRPEDSPNILRALALGLISLAHPLKHSALLCKEVSKKTIAQAAKDESSRRTSGEAGSEPICDLPAIIRLIEHQRRRAADRELHDTAKGFLADSILPTDVLTNYYKFEDVLLAKWAEICRQHNDRREQLRAMGQYLKSLVKNAGAGDRLNLAVLKLACDTARNEIYEDLMGQVIQLPAVSSRLDPISAQYNRTIHAVQPKLGGMVLALHPLWQLCLKSPEFISILRKCAANPKAVDNIELLNSAIAHAISVYAGLVALEEELPHAGTESVAVKGEPVATEPLPSEVVHRRNFVEELMAGMEQDKDVQVVRERILDGLSVEEVATKHGHTPGWVTKIYEQGLKKLRERAEQLGITPDAMVTFQPSQSQPEDDDPDSSNLLKQITAKWK